jgi:hypothetical protein
MSAEDYKLYNFIELHVKDDVHQHQLPAPISKPDRRKGKDRRKKVKYVPAHIKIKTDEQEIDATGDIVTATRCKDGEAIQATSTVIKKK